MKVQGWLEAFRAGKVAHEWAEIEVRTAKHHARFKVSADGARIEHNQNRRPRESAGAHAIQQLGDAMRPSADHGGALMSTPKLWEARFSQSTVRVFPCVATLIEANGSTANTTPEEHSVYLDVEIAGSSSRSTAGQYLVDNPGKPFVLANECGTINKHGVIVGMNHGWIVEAKYCKIGPVAGFYGSCASWKGIPLYPCVWLDPKKFFLIQRLGLGHGFGPLTDQDDYASPMVVVHWDTWLDGMIVPTSKVYTDPDLCELVTHDGKPLKWSRHPNVPELIPVIPPPSAPFVVLNVSADSIPDSETPTLPDPHASTPGVVLPWQDPKRTPGQRAVAWSREQLLLGVKEKPPGSNKGPEVSAFLKPCVRESAGAWFGEWLANTGGNWCAAFASAASFATHLPGDQPVPHLYRCSGSELEADAKRVGAWRPVAHVLSGLFVLEEGDIVILPRGAPGSWERHVCRFVRWLTKSGEAITPRSVFEAIGGNEGNTIRISSWRASDPLGFIEMATAEGRPAIAVAPEPEPPVPPTPEPLEGPAPPDGEMVRAKQWPEIVPKVDGSWITSEPHGVVGSSRRWRVTSAGIMVSSTELSDDRVLVEDPPMRTKGAPLTIHKIRDSWGQLIDEASKLTGVDPRMIAATIATEAGTNVKAENTEPQISDVSFGLMQTLTTTGYEMARRLGLKAPKPIPLGGLAADWRVFLFDPRNSILCGSMYLDYQNDRFGLQSDPILNYAAYNAGSPRARPKNPWGLAYFVHRDGSGKVTYDAIDVFAKWYGDACAVWSA